MNDALALLVAPSLPDARCAGRHELFDATIESNRTGPGGAVELTATRQAALAICHTCPQLAQCQAYVESLPARLRPLGVIAGRINTGRARRPAIAHERTA